MGGVKAAFLPLLKIQGAVQGRMGAGDELDMYSGRGDAHDLGIKCRVDWKPK